MSELIIDREAERERLIELSEADEPKMALVYGRRRVGKTYLLTHLWDRSQAFYFTASAVTPAQNRRQLIASISEWTGREHQPEDYPSWRTVFRLLFSLESVGNLVVVLDEFQYFGETEQDLTSVASQLNAVWEGPERPQRPLLLVLAGSAVRTMQALDSGGAPLYGRLSWKAKLEPFDYLDASRMVPFESLRDRAYTYGIFGGMPRYLDSVDPDRSLDKNIARLMLSPRGDVRGQIESAIFQEQGLRDVHKYAGILRAIGSGRTELSEIASLAGLEKHTSVRDKIHRLVDLGYVERGRNFDAGRTTPWRYRLEDPAFRFYYEFVTRYETALEMNAAEDVWDAHIAPELDTYMGHVFEAIVEQAYYRLCAERGLDIVSEWGRWEGVDRSRKSVEMDIVSRLAGGDMLTGAIKWNRTPVGLGVHRDHMRDLDRIADAGNSWAHEARRGDSKLLYVAAGGFEDGFEEQAAEDGLPVYAWTLEDLYDV